MSDAGFHNDNLDAATSRIIEGGSWKKQRVICVMPAGKSIPFKVAAALRGLITPPNQPFIFIGAEGMEVGEAYSRTIEAILADPNLREWEYLLTVEHDNLMPNDGLVRLLAQMEKHPELACIGGGYWTKGPAGVYQAWGDPNDPTPNYRPQPPKPGQLIECCGTGMGFNLWRLSMFRDEKLRRPWFKTIAGAEGCGTQDLYFWGDARKHGYRCGIDCDVKVGHMDETGFVW